MEVLSVIFLSALLLCKSDGLERTTFHLVFVTAAARRRAAVAVFIVFSRLKSFFFLLPKDIRRALQENELAFLYDRNFHIYSLGLT